VVVFPEGFSDAQFKELESAIKGNVPAIISPNFSIGVNVLWNLIAAAARHLQAYQYHMEITHGIICRQRRTTGDHTPRT
jgi:4-hydroxy-tetrahydrodipicolinate reductase